MGPFRITWISFDGHDIGSRAFELKDGSAQSRKYHDLL